MCSTLFARKGVLAAFLFVVPAWAVEPKPGPDAALRAELADVQAVQDRLQMSQEKTRQVVESQGRTLAEIQKSLSAIRAEAAQTNHTLADLQEHVTRVSDALALAEKRQAEMGTELGGLREALQILRADLGSARRDAAQVRAVQSAESVRLKNAEQLLETQFASLREQGQTLASLNDLVQVLTGDLAREREARGDVRRNPGLRRSFIVGFAAGGLALVALLVALLR